MRPLIHKEALTHEILDTPVLVPSSLPKDPFPIQALKLHSKDKPWLT